MKWIPVRTRKILPPKDDLFAVLNTSLPPLSEGDVVFITSKILSIHQGRCVKIGKNVNKRKLVLGEADAFIENRNPYWDFILTVKNSTLIPSSGIDESNGRGYYILWPKNASESARQLCLYLRAKYGIKKLAVVITDSYTTPLRTGVMGISIGFFGLEPVIDRRKALDVFGRKLKYTKVNLADALSAGAVLCMGESGERTPIVILRGEKRIRFTDKPTWKKITIAPRKDLYAPILKKFRTP